MAENRNLVLQLLITAKDEATSAFSKLFGYLDDNTKVIAGKIREAFSGLFGGGLSGAIEFESQLDRVAAKGGYTAKEMEDLAGQIRTVGATFGISGTEAAQGMEALAAAGLSAADAIKTLPSVLALASAEQISADAAATKLIDSLSVMGLGFDQAGRMADVLAKGANITTSSASQLAEALSEAGGTARAAGLDLESTVAALDLLHKNGIKGSEAGTALKAILTALLDPSSKASQELDKLGITSRDLGTVLGALQARGGEASTAILAFGTEAGPGLRALISEGQTGLNDYTGQLRSAEGAAQDAADQMGGNLKAALATLNSAWESLKAALLEPLLAPIAAQVRDLGKAFQEGLASEKFKTLQDGIKAFGEAAAQAIGDFVRSFDFSGALQNLADFSKGAHGAFQSVGTVGKDVANGVVIAWNAVTGGFRIVGAALLEVAASAVATLANMEQAASKVGLGSAQRAAELRQSAIDLENQAIKLLNQAADDGRELQGAFDQLGQSVDEVKAKAEDLAQTPIAPDAQALVPIQKSLKDYAGQLDQAKSSQAAAADAADEAQHVYLELGQLYDQGKASLYAYEEAKRKDAEAQAALKAATALSADAQRDFDRATWEAIHGITQESTTITAGIKTKKELADESLQGAKASGEYADALEKSGNAAANTIRAEIELAKAKGDSAAVQELTLRLAQQEVATAQAVAAVKAQEAAQIQAAYNQQKAYLSTIGGGTALQQQELELLRLKAVALGEEAKAAEIGAVIKQIAVEQTQQQTQQQTRATQTTEGATDALNDNTRVTAENNAERERGSGILASMMAVLGSARQRTEELSEATARLFDQMFTQLELGEATVANPALRRYAVSLNQVADQYADIRQKISGFQAQIRAADADILNGVNSVSRYFGYVAKAEAEASLAFYEQKLQAEQLSDSLERMADKGIQGYRGLETAMATLDRTTVNLQNNFSLLDQQELESLQAQIDETREKIKEMADETQSAKDRLAELNAELLEAQGQDQKAKLLREQLDYQQQLAEIEAQRAEAEALGNRELLAILNDQQATLEKIHATKMNNIESEADAEGEVIDKTTRRYRELGSAIDGAHQGAKALASADLGHLLGQTDKLYQTLDATRKLF